MLDLKKLLEGSVPSVDFSLCLEGFDFVDDSVEGSVSAKGVITNHSGVILLKGELLPSLNVSCARCGSEFVHADPIPFQAKITDKLANDDEEEFVLLVDHQLDIEELVRSTAILELPSRFLCSDDCKGLCPVCGKNLNTSPCDCDTKDRDPRWDVLKDYFSD